MSTQLSILPSVTENSGELRERFSSAAPFPHLVLEEFLDPELLRRLHDEFPDFDPQRAANEMGHIRGKAVHEQIATISPAYREEQAKLFRFKGWYRKEPGRDYPTEKAHIFEQLVFHALAEEYIGESKAAELMNMPLQQFRRVRSMEGGDAAVNQ